MKEPVKPARVQIDEERLNEYFGGDLVFADSVLQVLKQQLPDNISELELSVRNSDHGRVRHILHTLRPSLVMLGLKALANNCKELESELLRQHKPVQELSGMMQPVIAEMHLALIHINDTLAWIKAELRTRQ